jgi:TM2 domain-containing membrane protein YozV
VSDPIVPEDVHPIPPGEALEAPPQAFPVPAEAVPPPPWSGPPAVTYCYACGVAIDARAAICPRCGVAQQGTGTAKGHPNAVLGLILNIFFPGVGSLVVGKTSAGITQLIMFVLSIPLTLFVIGIPLYLAAWIWALVTGIQAFSSPQRPPGVG